MRKSKVRVDLMLTVILGTVFFITFALYIALPFLDMLLAPNPIADMWPYDPFRAIADGFSKFCEFNFASVKFLLIFIAGAALIVALLFWFIVILAKKKPFKLIYWAVFLVLAALTALLIMGLVLPPAHSVVLDGETQRTDLYVLDDLLGKYSENYLDPIANTLTEDALAAFEDPEFEGYGAYVFYSSISNILGWVILVGVAQVAILGVIIPFVDAGKLLKGEKKAKPAFEESEEVKSAREKEEEARRRREQEYIAYVEYAAGKQAREKEYEELCKAHGIPLKKDKEEAAEKRYYSEMSKLPVFKAEVVDEDEQYYKELAKELPVLNGTYVEPVKEEKPDYYGELKGQLSVLTKKAPVEKKDSKDDYYKELAKELPVLHERGVKKESKEEYAVRLAKELPILSRPVVEPVKEEKEREEEYFARVARELPVLKRQEIGGHKESEEEYFARVARELPVLKRQEIGGHKESDEEYFARVSKELPVFQPQQLETENEYKERVAREVKLFKALEATKQAELEKYYQEVSKGLRTPEEKKVSEEEYEESVALLKRSVSKKDSYYDKMKKELPVLNRYRLVADDDE